MEEEYNSIFKTRYQGEPKIMGEYTTVFDVYRRFHGLLDTDSEKRSKEEIVDETGVPRNKVEEALDYAKDHEMEMKGLELFYTRTPDTGVYDHQNLGVEGFRDTILASKMVIKQRYGVVPEAFGKATLLEQVLEELEESADDLSSELGVAEEWDMDDFEDALDRKGSSYLSRSISELGRLAEKTYVDDVISFLE